VYLWAEQQENWGSIPGRAEILACTTAVRLDLSRLQLVLLSMELMAMGHDTNH